MAPRVDLSTPRQTQAERRQESTDRLLAAGVDVIAERGFTRTTMAQIAERAGYSRETVRLRHGSKLELLETAITNGYEARLIASTRDRALSGLEQVLGVNDAIAGLYRSDPTFLRVVYVVNFESISTVPEFEEHSKAWLDQLEPAIAGAFRRGIEDGSVDPSVDCDEEAHHWVITAIGLAFWSMQRPDEDHAAMHDAWKARLRRTCGASS